jgi:Family of unknown function (DUF6516)
MRARALLSTRIVYAENAFAELVLWQVPRSIRGSLHRYKYRLAFVVEGECLLRYDNEAGKGDHRHSGGKESRYAFSTPEKLIADFQREIARWTHEDPGS